MTRARAMRRARRSVATHLLWVGLAASSVASGCEAEATPRCVDALEDLSCDDDHAHPECIDDAPQCICDDGYRVRRTQCTEASVAQCCSCLTQELFEGVLCFEQGIDRCSEELSAGDLQVPPTCIESLCSERCWFVVRPDGGTADGG